MVLQQQTLLESLPLRLHGRWPSRPGLGERQAPVVLQVGWTHLQDLRGLGPAVLLAVVGLGACHSAIRLEHLSGSWICFILLGYWRLRNDLGGPSSTFSKWLPLGARCLRQALSCFCHLKGGCDRASINCSNLPWTPACLAQWLAHFGHFRRTKRTTTMGEHPPSPRDCRPLQ